MKTSKLWGMWRSEMYDLKCMIYRKGWGKAFHNNHFFQKLDSTLRATLRKSPSLKWKWQAHRSQTISYNSRSLKILGLECQLCWVLVISPWKSHVSFLLLSLFRYALILVILLLPFLYAFEEVRQYMGDVWKQSITLNMHWLVPRISKWNS